MDYYMQTIQKELSKKPESSDHKYKLAGLGPKLLGIQRMALYSYKF
jgi:hypothetical protein